MAQDLWRRSGAQDPGRNDQTLDFRSEEHTSELQSQSNLVCRLLLEKKKEPERSSHASLEQPYCARHRLSRPARPPHPRLPRLRHTCPVPPFNQNLRSSSTSPSL